MAQKTGALIFDEQTDRYDIRFDLADYYGIPLIPILPKGKYRTIK